MAQFKLTCRTAMVPVDALEIQWEHDNDGNVYYWVGIGFDHLPNNVNVDEKVVMAIDLDDACRLATEVVEASADAMWGGRNYVAVCCNNVTQLGTPADKPTWLAGGWGPVKEWAAQHPLASEDDS